MAKRRTRDQKKTAEVRRKVEEKNTKSIVTAKKQNRSAKVSYSSDQILLIKRDLFKTVVVSGIVFILLFGIYIYMR